MGRWVALHAAPGHCHHLQLLVLCCLVSLLLQFSPRAAAKEYTKVFNSPGFVLGPGDVYDQYVPLDMPRGHIAIRELSVQLVDKDGTPIPLYETYIHHWVLIRSAVDPLSTTGDFVIQPNAGTCNPFLVQYFGLGSETRHTRNDLPDPYGIVVGDPKAVANGMVEMWLLNTHAIDTRGAVDRQRCIECLCSLYNETTDSLGAPLPPNYVGGLLCCHDKTHCPVEEGFQGEKRELFLQISMRYADYSKDIIPTVVYILDASDTRQKWDDPPGCQVEYDVPKCAGGSSKCVHDQTGFAFLPKGGHVVYIGAHLHSAGVSGSLHRENGEELCVSYPKYGTGKEVGNEEGYVVGMSTCYPTPGSMHVEAKEKLVLSAKYNNTEGHTGVMGLLYIVMAEDKIVEEGRSVGMAAMFQHFDKLSIKVAAGILAGVCLIAVAGVLIYKNRKSKDFRYEAI